MTQELRIMPEAGERVETGPVQFGDDWPGLFIRGDNALGDAIHLEHIQHLLRDHPQARAYAPYLRGLIGRLRSCDIRTLSAPQPEEGASHAGPDAPDSR